jgi:hypothetical protein
MRYFTKWINEFILNIDYSTNFENEFIQNISYFTKK